MTKLQKFLINNPNITVEICVGGSEKQFLIYRFYNPKMQAPYPYQIKIDPKTDIEKCEEDIVLHYSHFC